MENKQDYYKVGSRDNIVVSNSSLSHFIPKFGGSPLNFLEFLEGNKESNSKHFITGSLLHLWVEDKDLFHIAQIDKPSEKSGDIADFVINLIKNNLEESEIDKEEFLKPLLIENSGILEEDILYAARQINWNPKWGDEAIIKNLKFIIPYIQDVLNSDSNNKIYMTKNSSLVINNMINSIKNKQEVYESLFPVIGFSNLDIKREFEFYWEEKVEYYNINLKNIAVSTINCKMKLDILELDYDNKILRIKDLKTSKNSPYNFTDSFIKFNYARQFAFYILGISKFLPIVKDEVWKVEFYNIVVQKEELFECALIEIEDLIIQEEFKNIYKYLETIAWHKENNIWNFTKEEFENNGKIKIKLKDIEKN